MSLWDYKIWSFSTFYENMLEFWKLTKTAIQSCSYEKVFWKYAGNLQEITRAEVKYVQS